MNKINLPNVTLFSVACTRIEETIWALQQSMSGIVFHEVLLFTHEPVSLDNLGIRVIPIEKLDYKGYNNFVLFKLKDFIATDFSLLVQHDGFVVRPSKWDDKFFEYDYIGAPWQNNVHFTSDNINVRVGNGGFSFRSRKLLESFSHLNLPLTDCGTGYFHEDGAICVYHRKALEEYGIKYAPADVAAKFSRELDCSDLNVGKPFGFHRYRKHMPLALRLKFYFKDLAKKIHL